MTGLDDLHDEFDRIGREIEAAERRGEDTEWLEEWQREVSDEISSLEWDMSRPDS